jgi:hypothetical protein
MTPQRVVEIQHYQLSAEGIVLLYRTIVSRGWYVRDVY